jgi:MFS family permease
VPPGPPQVPAAGLRKGRAGRGQAGRGAPPAGRVKDGGAVEEGEGQVAKGAVGAPAAAAGARWLTADVWWIAMSAFCADLGYQAVLAVFPLFLVLGLHAPVFVYGLTTALAYGPGAAMGYVGGRAGDRAGRRRVALWGNAFLVLLALPGLVANAAEAVVLFAVGWWARNFRSPPRRAMLTEVVAPEHRGRAFGFLHALDVGGGTLAGLYAFLIVGAHIPYRAVLLVALLPLVASTVVLAFARAGARPAPRAGEARAGTAQPAARPQLAVYRAVMVAAALFGFSSYSAGFPILTIAQGTGSPTLGVLGYVIFLGVSALAGLWVGGRRWDAVRSLPLMGYLGAAVGSAGIGAAYALHWGLAGLYPAMAVLGFAIGVIETLEPTLISRVTPAALTSGGMGSLTASRSVGLFVANVALGVLYHAGPAYSYGYAALLGLAAMVVLLAVGEQVRRAAASDLGATA